MKGVTEFEPLTFWRPSQTGLTGGGPGKSAGRGRANATLLFAETWTPASLAVRSTTSLTDPVDRSGAVQAAVWTLVIAAGRGER